MASNKKVKSKKAAVKTSSKKKIQGKPKIIQSTPALFQISDSKLKALAPRLEKLRKDLEGIDIDFEAVRKDLKDRIPTQKDIDKAVEAGMAAYERERRRLERPKMDKYQEEEMREKLGFSLKQSLTSVAIDEELFLHNVKNVDYRMSIIENKGYIVNPAGDVVLEIGDLQDARAFDWWIIADIASIIMEVYGIIAHVAGVMVRPDYDEVLRVTVDRAITDSRFMAAFIDFCMKFGTSYQNWERAMAIFGFIFDLYESGGDICEHYARAMCARMRWYEKAWAIAKLIAGIASMFCTAAATWIWKIAVLIWNLYEFVAKILKLIPKFSRSVAQTVMDVRAAESRLFQYA